MSTKHHHGGAREGAGRKPVAPTTLMKSVKLTPEQWEKAREIGEGNAAEGIRRALDAVTPTRTGRCGMMCLGIEWNGVSHVARFDEHGHVFSLDRESLEHRIANIKQDGRTPSEAEYSALIELKRLDEV